MSTPVDHPPASLSPPPAAMPERTLLPQVFFDAVLMPHRSLSPTGFWILMALISGISFVAGMFFVLRGAWPVGGYMGVDVVLVYVAFRASYRSARFYETIKLTADALVVERFGPASRLKRWTFQPYWLRVEIDDPPEHDSQLVLTSHGKGLVIGSFLTPDERLEVATALKDALHRARHAVRDAEWAREPAASAPSEAEASRAG